MDISQLEVFLAVAREGGFSRAADKLYRTQSAVSQAIRKLETEIGEPLFDRSARDGQLTDAGRVLQEYAERLINLRENAKEALVELRELQTGKLVVGANEFTALYLLRVLADYQRLHPVIRIMVQRSLGSEIPDDVLRHKCEFGVLTYDPQDPELTSVVVYSDELIFVVPPQHPLARRIEGQHPATGRGNFCRAYRVVAVSRESDSGVQEVQDAVAHGAGIADVAGDQTLCRDGQRGRVPAGDQR